MLQARSAKLLVLTFAAVSAFAQMAPTPPTLDREQPAETTALQDTPPANCNVTLPSDGRFVPPTPMPTDPRGSVGGLGTNQFWFGSSKLWTMLPVDGVWRGWRVPTKPGDFVYDNKLPWFRMHPAFSPKDGPLTVTGKRLDGPALSFTETFQSNGFARNDDNAMTMGGISIPVFGCWHVTGRYKDQKLSFTVWVAPPSKLQPTSGTSSSASLQEQSAPETALRRIYVDAETEARSLVYKVTPEIPHGVDVPGTVLLHAVIGTDGRPHELQYVSGPQQLAQSAIDAVTWWQYRVTGEAEEIDTTIEVGFSPTGK
jgi:hypothetical protein